MSSILIIISSLICIGWGIAHLIPTKQVISGFGDISKDNKLIIKMEWIAEGLSICFIGTLVLILALMNLSSTNVGVIVNISSSIMLIIMAILTLFTGAKTSIIPIKICPFVKTTVAILWIIGSIV